MNKNIIIALGVALVVIGGGAAFVLTNKKDESSNSSQSAANTTTKPSVQESNTTISELLKLGEDRRCTFTGSDAGTEFNGTGYFSNNRMQSDFTTKTATETRSGSMIVTKDTQYFWDAASKKGVKTAVQASSQPTQQTSSQSGIDQNKNYTFKCEKWSVDESKFTPPADVQFQDLTQLLQNIPQVPTQ